MARTARKKLTVFVSYGHPERPIVERIAEYLRSRGHAVLMDTCEGPDAVLDAGRDWRVELERAVMGCEGVVACVSEHSRRDGGVCLNELAAETYFHGGNFRSVLLCDAARVTPFGPAFRTQWFDMSGWVRFRTELEACSARPREQLPDGFRRWFDPLAKKLAESLEDPDFSQFRDEMEAVFARLGRPGQPNRVASLVRGGMVGREWLAQELGALMAQDGGEGRLSVVWGGPGTGKSAFAAHLAGNSLYRQTGVAVWGWAFCDRAAGIGCTQALKALAASLAQNLPEYRAVLYGLLAGPSCPDLDALPPVGLARALLCEPLRVTFDGMHEPVALVVDGVDEAGNAAGNDMAEVLAALAGELPGWVRLIATSRDVASTREHLGGFQNVVIREDDGRNVADIKAYLQKNLGPLGATRIGIDLAARRSEGVFLCAEVVVGALRRACSDGGLDLRDDAALAAFLDGLPSGLHNMFGGVMRSCAPSLAEYRSRWRLAFGCLLARRELPQSELRRALGWTRADLWDFSRDFEPFVIAAEGEDEDRVRVALRHRSLADWIGGPQAGAWRAFGMDGAGALGLMCLAQLDRGAEHMSAWEVLNIEPLLEEARLAPELARARGSSELAARMLDEMGSRQEEDPAATLALAERLLRWPACAGATRACTLAQAASCHERLGHPSLGEGLLGQACAVWQAEGAEKGPGRAGYARALAKRAELLTKTGRRGEAAGLLELAIGLFRGLAEEGVGNKRDGYADELAQALSWLAVLRKECGPGEDGGADKPFEEALALRERLYRADPQRFGAGYAWTLNSFSTFLYDRDSASEASRRMLDEALAVRRERRERLDDVPSKRDFAWSLGDLAKRDVLAGSCAQGAHAYGQLVEVYRDLCRDSPGAFRRDLAWALGRLGWALRSDGRGEAALAPLSEACGLWGQLAREDPQRSAPDLANLLDYLAGTLRGLGRDPEADEAWEEARRAYLLCLGEGHADGGPKSERAVEEARREWVARIPARFLPLDHDQANHSPCGAGPDGAGPDGNA